MSEGNNNNLGRMLKKQREKQGFSIKGLGREIEVSDSTILRIESGSLVAPSPQILAKLSKALSLPLEKLYSLTGYAVPATELPAMPEYLRKKYGDLPETARQELTSYLRRMQEVYHLS